MRLYDLISTLCNVAKRILVGERFDSYTSTIKHANMSKEKIAQVYRREKSGNLRRHDFYYICCYWYKHWLFETINNKRNWYGTVRIAPVNSSYLSFERDLPPSTTETNAVHLDMFTGETYCLIVKAKDL